MGLYVKNFIAAYYPSNKAPRPVVGRWPKIPPGVPYCRWGLLPGIYFYIKVSAVVPIKK